MGFQINTNINSLNAQDYLRVNGDFQAKTINRVTSGLRIVSSGDDAAGLAIANGYRSDQAVLSQGVRNANDGLSQLQIVDGGINNISKLLDRARTLATQSASGTFTGDRSVLNKEFQSVIGEIDRQAQAIGLDTNGTFARNTSVFIGGGKTNGNITAIDNGSVSVDLSTSTVDSKSLGLRGVSAKGVSSIDIGAGSASTSVSAIVNDSTNVSSLAAAGYTDLYFRGPGFGDNDRIKVSVNLAGVTDTSTLTAAINTAIASAGNGATAAATAFKNSGIQAVVNTSSTGTQQLSFTSGTTAFQVSAGDRLSNALLGNVTSSSNPTGLSLTNTVTGAAASAADATTIGAAAAGTIKVRIQGASLGGPVDLNLTVGSATTVGQAIADLSSQVSQNSSLQAAGITLNSHSSGSALVFSSSHGEQFTVAASGDLNDVLGLGSYQSSGGASGTFDYTTTTGAGATFAAGSETLEFSVGGGAKVAVNVTLAAGTQAEAITALNAAFAADTTLSGAGLVASASGGQVQIASNNGSAFRLNSVGNANILGFNNAGATGVAAGTNAQSAITTSATFKSDGSAQTGVLNFSAIRGGNDDQTITFTANDPGGNSKSLAVVLRNDATSRSGASLDESINAINTALQQSNDATLQKIVAVKEQSGGAEGIRFLSTNSSFKVAVGTNASGTGIGSQGTVQTGSLTGTGSTADISSQDTAKTAVEALAKAVNSLGSAQAVVGRGQNQFNYAVNLASSQLSNLAAAESRIRDADLASEAANLTKAQVLLQAGIAALAQANSAPQQVLSLLRG